MTTPTKEDYYLAQIAREVYCVLLKKADRSKVKLEHFLLKFSAKKDKTVDVEEGRRKAEASKLAWAVFLGSHVAAMNQDKDRLKDGR